MKNQPNNRFSLSTAFNVSKHRNWTPLLEEHLSMGFSAAELNVEIPETWMNEIEKSVNDGRSRISSLHNFCPAIDPLPPGRNHFNAYLPTADDPEERASFVKYIKRTITYAERLGGRVIVVHAGEVPTEPSGRSVYAHVVRHGLENSYFRRLRDNCLAERAKNAPHYLDNLKRSLDGFAGYASSRGVTVAFENRFHLNEIPDIKEADVLFNEYAGAHVGLWYDAGHAEMMRRLGVFKSGLEFLQLHPGKLIGMHLHDFRGVEDHFAPGAGEIDFSRYKPFVTPSTILVIEAHPKSSPAEVSASITYLTKALF